LSKRRDALRRGIRSLIDVTSREMADLEGHPLPDDAPRPGDTPAGRGPSRLANEPLGGPARRPGEAPAPGTKDGQSKPVRRTRVSHQGSARDGSGPATKRGEPEAGRPSSEDTSKSPRARPRPRRRAVSQQPVNGVNPQQAQSSRGVCFAYFVDSACWHVPNAYCNTALQVCVLRNCPVYHLHKDSLERRFAKKFKHLW
jgi:hypothetical protein